MVHSELEVWHITAISKEHVWKASILQSTQWNMESLTFWVQLFTSLYSYYHAILVGKKLITKQQVLGKKPKQFLLS